MKKIFFSASFALMLFACTKDKAVADLNNEEALSANGRLNNSSDANPNTVRIVNSTFSPDSLMININSTVAWVNDDNTVHTVTSDRFDSGDIPPGAMYKHTFDNTGSYYYHCRYHGERGVVVVAGIR